MKRQLSWVGASKGDGPVREAWKMWWEAAKTRPKRAQASVASFSRQGEEGLLSPLQSRERCTLWALSQIMFSPPAINPLVKSDPERVLRQKSLAATSVPMQSTLVKSKGVARRGSWPDRRQTSLRAKALRIRPVCSWATIAPLRTTGKKSKRRMTLKRERVPASAWPFPSALGPRSWPPFSCEPRTFRRCEKQHQSPLGEYRGVVC